MNTVVTSREAILSVSTQLVAEKGLRAINMRTVAQRCGVAVGSVYNYFPSKSNLITATVETIWQSMFHMAKQCVPAQDLVECVKWIFETILLASEEYPAFFTLHSMSFTTGEKEKGREIMERYFIHIKNGLMKALVSDVRVKPVAFDGDFSREAFVDFIFSNILTLLISGESSCAVLLEIIRRAVY